MCVWQITPGNNVKMVTREAQEELDTTLVAYTPAERKFSVQDYYQRIRGRDYFWSLPRQFLGNKVAGHHIGINLSLDAFMDHVASETGV